MSYSSDIEAESVLIQQAISKQVRAILLRYNGNRTRYEKLAVALAKPIEDAILHYHGEAQYSAHDLYRLCRAFSFPPEFFLDGIDRALFEIDSLPHI